MSWRRDPEHGALVLVVSVRHAHLLTRAVIVADTGSAMTLTHLGHAYRIAPAAVPVGVVASVIDGELHLRREVFDDADTPAAALTLMGVR